jgi:hypothetical protein
MTQYLIHYNGRWSTARLGVFESRGRSGEVVPVPLAAWVTDDVEGALICLCGEENCASVLRDPDDGAMKRHEAVVYDSREGLQYLLEQEAKR